MSSKSSVTIIGRLTRDPEQKASAKSDAMFTKLRLAWNDRKDEPGYIDATLFGKTGEIAAKYLKKGSHVSIINARLEWREYEVEGQKRTAYSLVGGDLVMLGKDTDDSHAAPAPAKLDDDSDIPF